MIDATIELPAPPPVVWDWLNDPIKRERWWWAQIHPVSRPRERNGMGAVNHRVHGKDSCLETITGWRPFEYLTTDLIGHPFSMLCRIMWLLTPTENGTSLELRSMVKLGPGLVGRMMSRTVDKKLLRPSLERLEQAFAQEAPNPYPPPADNVWRLLIKSALEQSESRHRWQNQAADAVQPSHDACVCNYPDG
jgi:hypothetical protein